MITLDRAVGIDLGTTNSEVAVLVPSEREVLVFEDRFGRKTIPSAVAWDPSKEAFLVGRPARARRGKTPAPIESIKRRMGQGVKVDVGPHQLTPEEVSAKILAELGRSMSGYLGDKASEGVTMRVSRCVITVPAYFDAPQIEATRKAGELAGLRVLGILQEPTAAAIYHTFLRKIESGNYLVYDLGGGTFDVSILRCIAGEYQVLAIDGDNFLGGDDFDRRYAEHLRKTLAAKGYALDLDIRADPADLARFEALVHLAQEVKESLSTSEVVSLSRQGVLEDKEGESVSLELEVSRADYERIIEDLVERTIECSQRALAESEKSAKVTLGDIDHVILVGGSTRVPLVRRRVIEAIASRCKNTEPLADEVDTVVALGAAVHAAQLGGLTIEAAGEPDAARAHFLTPLAGKGSKLRVSLQVEAKGAHSVAVLEGGATLCEAGVPEGGAAFRVELAPSAEGDVELALSLRDETAKEIASIPFVMYRGETRPRASALSRASVLAKDIGVEIVRSGRRERRVLLAKGVGLPAETQHTFFTADQSGTVVVRLLQGRMPIKTLALTVSRELPVGTPVELTIKCDEAMRVEAKALVDGRELWATVQPAEQVLLESEADIEKLLADAETARSAMWGNAGDYVRREVDQLTGSIREVLRTDPAKLSALTARLRLLLEEVVGSAQDPMQPPMHMFEAELNGLRRIVYRTQGVLVGLDREAWEARIRDLEERANEAYSALDATAWRRTYNEVQALYETANQEEFANRRLDDPAYIALRRASVDRWRMRTVRALHDFVPSTEGDLARVQQTEKQRLLDLIAAKVDEPLRKVDAGEVADVHEVRRLIFAGEAELERIDTALERLPSLGLVTERGSSGGRA